METLNVGPMTGRRREVVDLMVRRKIQVICVQETRWKGNSARELGDGYTFFYSGSDDRGRNGVRIGLDKDLKNNFLCVNRKNDRIISLKIQLEEIELNIVSIYALQAGCEDEEKEAFWREVKAEITRILNDERIIFESDLNGHIKTGNTKLTERIKRIWGTGTENVEGVNIVDFALATDLAILNTFFKKQEDQLNTYRSGNRSSQIDFLLCRREHLK